MKDVDDGGVRRVGEKNVWCWLVDYGSSLKDLTKNSGPATKTNTQNARRFSEQTKRQEAFRPSVHAKPRTLIRLGLASSVGHGCVGCQDVPGSGSRKTFLSSLPARSAHSQLHSQGYSRVHAEKSVRIQLATDPNNHGTVSQYKRETFQRIHAGTWKSVSCQGCLRCSCLFGRPASTQTH